MKFRSKFLEFGLVYAEERKTLKSASLTSASSSLKPGERGLLRYSGLISPLILTLKYDSRFLVMVKVCGTPS